MQRGDKPFPAFTWKGALLLKKRIFGNPLWLSLVMTVVLAWIQIDSAYFIRQSTTHRQMAIYAAVGALLVFFVLIIVYVAMGRRGGLTNWEKRSSVGLGFFGVAAGAQLLVNGGLQAWDYYGRGMAPAPYYTVFSPEEGSGFGIDRIFLNGTLIFAIGAGVCLLTFGILWMFGGRVDKVPGQLLGLFPILWAFCRLARYVQSYVSTIRNAFSAAQAAVLLMELLFFYYLGQHLNGRVKPNGVGLPAVSFAFGMIAVSAFAAHAFLQRCCPDTLEGAVIIVEVSDLLCGLLALAIGTVTCSKKTAENTREAMQTQEALDFLNEMGVTLNVVEPEQPDVEPEQPEVEPEQPEVEPEQPEVEPEQPTE